jgi:hypothetical protein
MRLRQILKHLLISVIQYKSEYHIPTKDPSENWQKIATHYYNICCELSIRSSLTEFVSFPNKSDLCGQFPCSVPTQTHKLFHMTSNWHIISQCFVSKKMFKGTLNLTQENQHFIVKIGKNKFSQWTKLPRTCITLYYTAHNNFQ